MCALVHVGARFVVEGGGGGGVSTIKITWADTRATQRRWLGCPVPLLLLLLCRGSPPSSTLLLLLWPLLLLLFALSFLVCLHRFVHGQDVLYGHVSALFTIPLQVRARFRGIYSLNQSSSRFER